MARQQFRILFREFLFRMVDRELLSAHAQGDGNKLLGQFAALLLFFGVLLTLPAAGFGGAVGQGLLIARWSAEHALIETTMLVVGLFAVLTWDSTFPDRRDVLVLAPLPVRARTMFAAKVTAVAAALGLTVLALHSLCGLVWPLTLNGASRAETVPSFTSGAALRPVDVAHLKPGLDRAILPALRPDSGIAIAVVQHGARRIFTWGTAKPDSLFETGSVGKTFTAVLLARMVAQGRVKLDQPLRDLLPPEVAARPRGLEITLLDLATQHSGLPRMPDNLRDGDLAGKYTDYHLSDLYAYVKRHGVAKPPDAGFQYSNLGFALLGQALANRAGTGWASAIDHELLAPLGMRDTVVALSADQERRFLPGHDPDHRRVPPLNLDGFVGAGGLRSTVRDMLVWVEANLHPERQKGSLGTALAQSHVLRAEAGAGRIGLAWFYSAQRRMYWHGGTTSGFTADVFFSPETDTGGVVLSNTGGSTAISADIIGEHLRGCLGGKPAIEIREITVPASGGVPAGLRMFAAYWFTMIAAAAFIYGAVLTLQGLAAQLPRRVFLRLSSILQLGCFCIFVSVYFLQPMLATPETLVYAQGAGRLGWSPSFWFLGLLQQLSGSPALLPLAYRAWIGLGAALGGAAAAYGLSYFRTLRRIVEEPDIVPAARGGVWLPAFGNPLQTAVVRFSIRTLCRSRQHRLILAFYLGIGFALTISFLRTPLMRQISAASALDPWHQASVPLLASSIVFMGFAVIGMSMVFTMPLDLPSNWIFRITPVHGGPAFLAARRTSLLALSVVPVWTACAVLLLSLWPWQQVVRHLGLLAVLGLIVAEIRLGGAQKIPFTCSWLPGRSNVHMAFWISIGLVLTIIAKAAEMERRVLYTPGMYAVVLSALVLLAAGLWWRNAVIAKSEETGLRFEEEPADRILTLQLAPPV
jgi:CubicO group peptidase (beta-lactamase class C family)